MVQLDFSPETLTICVQKILKHSDWKECTKHYKQTLVPRGNTTVGSTVCTVCVSNNNYYLKHEFLGVKWVPSFVGQSLLCKNRFTYWYGPYAFVNDFETTSEGQYLIKMLEYSHLTERAQQKVNDILDIYRYWVQIDKDFMETLRKRDDSKR